jgi:hypothetical protein
VEVRMILKLLLTKMISNVQRGLIWLSISHVLGCFVNTLVKVQVSGQLRDDSGEN